MKKSIKILGIIFCVFLMLLTGIFFKMKYTKVPDIEITNIDLSTIEDGIYFGEYSTKLVKVKVEVEVKDNIIISIIILEHDNGLGKKAEKILEEIINQQSLDVEGISGATESSNTIKKAVENALLEK